MVGKNAENATSPYRRQLAALTQEFSTWRAQYREISEYQLPRMGRFLSANKDDKGNDGTKKHQKIINGTAGEAIKIASAGLMGGTTSPTRPWFRLALSDRELMDFAPVKEWLHLVRNRLLTVFSRSNFYDSTTSVFKELITFGTGCMFMQEDFETVLRCRPFTIGEYKLMLDSN